MKFILHIFFLSVPLCFSCSNDEDVPPFFELSCLGSATTPIITTSCESFPPSSQICEAVHVGDFTLEEETRSYLQQYCRQIGDVDVFVNANGERIDMEIYFKNFINTHLLKNTFIPCENDSLKNIGACIGLEVAQVKMRSSDETIDIALQLSTKLSAESPLEAKVADYVDITRAVGNNTFVQEFSVIVHERNIGFSQAVHQENLGTIDLLGETFDEVISADISGFVNSQPFKYYYTQRFGLVAFQDTAGVLWRLEL